MMETKECRHCKQPIHKDARRCQHCQGFQGWISDQKDPRTLLVVFLPLIVILLISIPILRTTTKTFEKQDFNRSSLLIDNINYRFGIASNSERIYVYGDISNSSSVDAARICLRINILNHENRLIDNFIEYARNLIVPAHGKAGFRVISSTSVSASEIKKVEVLVERSQIRNRWD